MKKRKVRMFGAKCPLGSQCKKGDSYIKSCRTRADAQWYAENHLEKSTYHNLTRSEVDQMMSTRVVIDSWMVQDETASAQERQEDPNWWRWSCKRSWTAPEEPPAPSTGAMGAHTKALVDDAATAMAIAGPGAGGGTAIQRLAQQRVQLSYNEIAACVDALRRARYAAQAAKALCEKAAKAFNEEERCLDCCHEVVKSYLPGFNVER